MESGLPRQKCGFCFPRAGRCPVANSGGGGGSGYLYGDTEKRICLVRSTFIRSNTQFPGTSQTPFLLKIQRSAKQGREMGAILHNTISNSFNDNILSYLPAIYFIIIIFFSSLALLIFFFFLILSVYFRCRFIRCTVKCHLALQNCHHRHFMNGIIHRQTI